MRVKIFLFFLILGLCGNSVNAIDESPQVSIEAEIETMLKDTSAFPIDSKQYKSLNQLRNKLPSLLSSRGVSTVDENASETGIGYQGEEEIAHQNEQPTPAVQPKTMRSYATQMKHHRAVMAEHTQITALLGALNTKLNELRQQREAIQKYHKDIQNGAGVGEEYEAAIDQYEQSSHDYDQMHAQYKDALNQYNENRQAYRNTLSR